MPNGINNIKLHQLKNFIHNFFYELFYVLTGAILIFACLELFCPGVISAYLNLNYVLIFWLIVGMIILY